MGRVAFIGDIMSVGNRRLTLSPSVASFIADCDYLIGNLEATITDSRSRNGVIFGALQWQDAHVIEVLESLFPPAATYLSVANNHAGDFEEQDFKRSVNMLEERGFHLFGHVARPYVDLGNAVRLHASTMWSNQLTSRVQWFESAPMNVDTLRVNILYPHWGYELELYPRPEIVEQARVCLQWYDAILGHHSHNVQPIAAESIVNRNRFVAYSLGDFCCGIPSQAYRYGMVVKLEVGESVSGDRAIGNVEWRILESRRKSRGILEVCLTERLPYFEHKMLSLRDHIATK